MNVLMTPLMIGFFSLISISSHIRVRRDPAALSEESSSFSHHNIGVHAVEDRRLVPRTPTVIRTLSSLINTFANGETVKLSLSRHN